ncbi:MAG: hypothetical protein PHY47_19305 [Lachnospiraceae bacterium]|nr:hypothetical protein [Lachnospiraceae bacterium]
MELEWNSYQTIAEASHAAVSLEGIAIEAQDTIATWLTEIGVTETNTQTDTVIKITIGDITLDGVFYAQTDDPGLSADVIPIGKVTSDLSVFENLNSCEEITFSLAE